MNVLWVAIGGALGASLRFFISGLLARLMKNKSSFPYPVLIINWTGSFLLGLWNSDDQFLSVLLTTGVLGGFTTFSTFSIETVTLFKSNKIVIALVYIVLTIVGSILSYGLGAALIKE